jgi:hypothetical protein
LETKELIERLSADVRPVVRLPAPLRRLALWLLIVLPYAVLAIFLFHDHAAPGLAEIRTSPRFVVEQSAALLTAVTAAYAAFVSLVPGGDRRVLWLPLLPLAVWLASIGQGCFEDWIRFGASGLRVRPDTDCILPMLVIGIVPAIAILAMLRHGAPLMPRLTLALGGVAVAGLVNFVLQLFHARDVSIMVLVWHIGFVIVLAALASLAGPSVIGWRRLKASLPMMH